MAFRPVQNLPDQLYNLITDPPSYPRFTSADERGEYIREEWMSDYFNRLETRIRHEIRAIVNSSTWAEPRFREWARENNLPDNIEYRISPPGPNDDHSEGEEEEEEEEEEEDLMDEDEDPPFDRNSYNFAQAQHLPLRLRLQPRFPIQPPPPPLPLQPPSPFSDSDEQDNDEQPLYQGRSRERSRSPLRRSPGLERSGDSSEGSPESPYRGRSRERSRSPLRRSPDRLERRGDSSEGGSGRSGGRGDSREGSSGYSGGREDSSEGSSGRSGGRGGSREGSSGYSGGRENSSEGSSGSLSGRRRDSPESSLGRLATRAEFLGVAGGRRSASNSPQQSRSPGRRGSGGDSSESSRVPRARRDESPQSGRRRRSRSNSPQGNGSPGRGARSGSSDRGRSPRRSRPNSPQGSEGSRGRNRAAPRARAAIEMPTLNALCEREIDRRMRPWMQMFHMALVGEQAHAAEGTPANFGPRRGDLIISHPDSRHIGLPNSVGYIASYLGESYNFTTRHLVLRVGNFQVIKGSAVLQELSFYKPFTYLELYAYRPKSVKSSWRFLGHQAELRNVVFQDEPDVSPGKFLKVGTPVLGSSSNFVEALVPRRGDVIIKRGVWAEDFSHPENFWYSMVKWHRGRQFSFFPGDMLVRRLVGNDARKGKWGWAELYQYEGISVGWVFWGRTQHAYDIPWPEREHCILLYEYDDGADSEDDIRKERVNPRS